MKHWTSQEEKYAIEEIQRGKPYKEIAEVLGKTLKSVKIKLQRLKHGIKQYAPSKEIRVCECCNQEIKSHGIKFCSSSCAAKINNSIYRKRVSKGVKVKPARACNPRSFRPCFWCLSSTKNKKYCSNLCEVQSKEASRFLEVEKNDSTLSPRRYKSYLINRCGNKCMECGWDKINPKSNKCPIELEHIDGDYKNNKLENLKLLCPNCHSLTPTYKGLNIGNGRYSRMERYRRGESF